MNINNTNERKRFLTKKARSRQCPTETIMDADYADDLVLLTNTPTDHFVPILQTIQVSQTKKQE